MRLARAGTTNMSSLACAAVGASHGFAADPRFANIAAPAVAAESGNPLTRAWNEGHAAGRAELAAELEAKAELDAGACAKLEIACAQLDAAQQELLRRRLAETVAALCEASLAPLALDPDLLAQRAGRAAAMLARADDAKVLRLHPQDIALVGSRLPDCWTIVPDPALERGALRFETGDGGIEDGPGQWRRAILEALGEC